MPYRTEAGSCSAAMALSSATKSDKTASLTCDLAGPPSGKETRRNGNTPGPEKTTRICTENNAFTNAMKINYDTKTVVFIHFLLTLTQKCTELPRIFCASRCIF